MNLDPSSQIYLYSHKEILNELIELYINKKLPNKIILSGEKGIGKSTLAYHLINYILSQDEENAYDRKNLIISSINKSFKLLQNKSNPNFYLIDVDQGKTEIDINQIRELIIDLNKSSFNLKPRIVLIDNIEFLNKHSINSLLKILEEPNDNINFILINNNKKILPTLKSRCLIFKVYQSYDETIEVVNKLINNNIYDLINIELLNNYNTPGQLLKIIKFSLDHQIDLKNIDLKNFLSFIIKNKIFKNDKLINDFIYSLLELYFRNCVSINNIYSLNLYYYFVRKIYNTKIYNLDQESLFMEFEDRILNG